MNLSVIQTMASMNVGNTSQSGRSAGAINSTGGNSFGSVFNSLASNTVAVNSAASIPGGQIPDEAVLAIFNAANLEELGLALQSVIDENNEKFVELQTDANLPKIDGDTQTIADLQTEFDLPVQGSGRAQKPLPSIEEMVSLIRNGSIEEVAEVMGIQPERLVESLQDLLKIAGVKEAELDQLNSMGFNIWQMIDMIDKVASKLFEKLSNSLVGKGDIPKQQAVELLALLKTVTLAAPNMDLVLKQEQQIFSLGNYLDFSGERFENVLILNATNKNSMVQLVDGRQGFRFLASETNQSMSDHSGGNSDAGQSDVRKESVPHTVSSAHIHMNAKAEFTVSELGNREATRSEALIREMQAIFKRANFGQTSGTNRLLIKLYPEHLGQVRIELLETNGILTARILASTALGKEMLDSQQAQLRQAFVQQNIQVDRLDISQTLQESNRGERDQNAFNGQFKREQEQSEEKQQSGDDDMTFQEFMIELEV